MISRKHRIKQRRQWLRMMFPNKSPFSGMSYRQKWDFIEQIRQDQAKQLSLMMDEIGINGLQIT